MIRRVVALYLIVVAGLGLAPPAMGARHTPLAWQQLVVSHTRRDVMGQRKNTSWIRDLNRNFIDDLIDSMFTDEDTTAIVVDFSKCVSVSEMRGLLEPVGRITYIAKLISCAYVDGAKVRALDSLATRPEVAMIEWQTPSRPLNDVATRAIQARKSDQYPGVSAEDVTPTGLTGTGVNIAILDTGVKDSHAAFEGAFVKGFDATIYEDADGDGIDDSCGGSLAGCVDPDDEDGNKNPEPETFADHGTAVAGIALGRASPDGYTCRNPGGSVTANCTGTAPGAGLVDVKTCQDNDGCADEDVMEGIDWVGLNAALPIGVANISIGDCSNDDGTSAEAEAVNYLAAIGVVPVVGHGNADFCTFGGVRESPGSVRTGSPGSASFAITVAAVNDHVSVLRSDDSHYTNYLKGPRSDFSSAGMTPLAQKPDVAAPGETVYSAASASSSPNKYFHFSGTSFATPYVAGAAALLREAHPSMNPGSVKNLLIQTADRGLVGFSSGATWDPAYGAGEISVGAAAFKAPTTDVKFPTCIGAGASPGAACELTSPMDSWNNDIDIRSESPPQVDVPNKLYADIVNTGGVSAAVTVNFGVFYLAAGTNAFYHIGSQTSTVGPGAKITLTQEWTPIDDDHQCVQVMIDFGLDTNYGNNVTQRNFEVAASRYNLRVINPFPKPVRFQIVPVSTRADWPCLLDMNRFELRANECSRVVKVAVDPPPAARGKDAADCRMAVWATPIGATDSTLIGGATVRTVVPVPCRLDGRVVDQNGAPVSKAILSFRSAREQDGGQPSHGNVKTAIANQKGEFHIELLSYVPHEVTIKRDGIGAGSMRLKWWCGSDPLVFELRPDAVKVRPRR